MAPTAINEEYTPSPEHKPPGGCWGCHMGLIMSGGRERWYAGKGCTVHDKLRIENVHDEFYLPHNIEESDDSELVMGKLYLRGAVSFLHAAPGAGKSFVALDLACRRANGLPWLDSYIMRGKTLYVYTESAKRLWKRLAAWEIEHGMPLSPSDLIIRPGRFQLDSDGVIKLILFCQANHVDFVIIDNLLTTSTGTDAASQKEMSVQLDGALMLAEAIDGHVMIVHHDNRKGEYLGTTMIDAIADTRLHLTVGSGGVRHLAAEKNRDLPTFSASLSLAPIEVRPGTGKYSCVVRDISQIAAAMAKEEDKRTRLIKVISAHPETSTRDVNAAIRSEFSVRFDEASGILQAGIDDGYITKIAGRHGGFFYVPEIPDRHVTTVT